jgi:PHP family Zn ribbon phosphoesterase
MTYRFDLHIHSCLSPCADLGNSPTALAKAAKAAGLNGVMLSDHNTSRNSQAFATACQREGLEALFGMEITTAEEFHVLAAFDTLAQAEQITELITATLPKRLNQPLIFGDQYVVNADDEIEEQEWHLLSAPTTLTIQEIEKKVHGLNGLLIACHINRHCFSVFSQLGGLSGDEGFDAVELSRHAQKSDWTPKILGLPILRSSDAHTLAPIGLIWNEAQLEAFTIQHLRAALKENRVINT